MLFDSELGLWNVVDRVVRLLASHDRSTINDEDEGSNMPIHLAALNGHANVIETLLEFGAQIDARYEISKMLV